MAKVDVGQQPLLDAEAGCQAASFSDQAIRMGFIRKVYGIVFAQLVLSIIIAVPVAVHAKTFGSASVAGLQLFSTVMLMVTLLAMFCCQDLARRAPQNYICLFVFTICEGVMLGGFCSQHTLQSVILAFVATALVVGCLTLYASFTKTDFTGAGPYLLGALFALCGTSLVLWLACAFGTCSPLMIMFYNVCGVILFSLYIVYDTQMIVGGDHSQKFEIDDYVFAALTLYLDVINLFIYLVQLFDSNRS